MRIASLLALLASLIACQTAEESEPSSELPDYSSRYPLDDTLRLHHIQARGTHNSYHIEPENPADPSHEYTHAPLDEGLGRLGLRQFELDLHYDRQQEAYTIFHLPVIDEETTCYLFTECLQLIKDWSDANPGHHPIFIWLEPKDDIDLLDNRFDPISDYDAIDAEIRSVWPEHRLLTPDDVQGDSPTLRDALTERGWPTLAEARDSILFGFLDTEDHGTAYSRAWTSLEGRAMFVNVSDFDHPLAAVAKINNPREKARIDEAHARNMLVGSNVDSADSDDATNAEGLAAALANGVHFMSSDLPELVEGRSYALELPRGQPSRCNPVTAPVECSAADIEALP